MRLDSEEINKWAGTGLIYLASPYNHADKRVRESRFKEVCRVASVLMGKGLFIFSPISHAHPIALMGKLPHGWEYWQKYDRKMLWCCTELWVVKMEGWDYSEGVKGEIEIAQELGIPIVYLDL